MIDTANKRRAMLNFGSIDNLLAPSLDTLDQEERLMRLGLRLLSAAAAAFGAPFLTSIALMRDAIEKQAKFASRFLTRSVDV